MGTRAIYKFWDEMMPEESFFVYKHYDNYPSGAREFIENAKSHAWKLPRYEACEFASAFVSANKNQGGGEVRLVSQHYKNLGSLTDTYSYCDYFYDVHFDRDANDFRVEISKTKWMESGNVWCPYWRGFLSEMTTASMGVDND